jgi:diguanylate cyclase (GGDEF)-like protein
MTNKIRTAIGFLWTPDSGATPSVVVRSIPLRGIWWAAILLLGLSTGAVGWTIWELRTDAIRAAMSDSGNIAAVFANQLSRSLGLIDTTFLEVASMNSKPDIYDKAVFQLAFNRPEIHDKLEQYRDQLPHVYNIGIADPDGQIVVSTAAWPTPDINVADRDYFQSARARADGQLSTSIPIQNRVNGTQTIVFARRLVNSRGAFAGIVFASVNFQYFEAIYKSTESIRSLIFTFVRGDGTILFRYPGAADLVGQKLTAESAFQDVLTNGTEGYRVHARADGNFRYVSARAVPNYPLFVNISVTEAVALAGWVRRSATIGVGSAILLLCSIYLLIAISRQVRDLDTSRTALTEKSEQLAHMARYDAMTGLANRALFMITANEALGRVRRSRAHVLVLMIDLDRFKAVNDSLGHATGDALLKAVADRLREIVQDVNGVARFGGDEFAIIMSGPEDQHHGATALADRILQAITEPYELDGRTVVIGASIGMTFAPGDADDVDALIRNADLALYKAKSEGRNRHRFFDASMEAEARQRRELEENIRAAMSRNEFELHYQTIIDLGKAECCGAEALVRWRHGERGLIPPDQFISAAEESGLIVPLGAWILRNACAEAAKWPTHLRVAVNLSPVQFTQGDLLETIQLALDESGLDAARLELEITETILLEGNEENLAVLREIKKLGVSIALDDFGIGYSSMHYLQMFPFDKIKIDKCFIQSMPNHSESAAIVCAIAGLGRSLDIETTAEGVETLEQLAFLRSAGCPSAQGYLFSRPVPASGLSFEQPQSLRGEEKAA